MPYGAIEDILPRLQAVLGNRLDRSPDVRRHHGTDEGWNAPVAPEAVAFPESTEEVARLVEICAAGRVPVIPFGAGTSFEGEWRPCTAGSASTSRHEPDPRGERGRPRLHGGGGRASDPTGGHLGPRGLFFPVDPGADATIGGMAATRASGTQTVGYGAMREAVLAVTAVLADGRVIRTARRARKSSAGYDLTHLLVGSEGTLGVITEVTLRVYGIPEAAAVGICAFATLGERWRRRSPLCRWESAPPAWNCSTRCRSRRPTPTRASTCPPCPPC